MSKNFFSQVSSSYLDFKNRNFASLCFFLFIHLECGIDNEVLQMIASGLMTNRNIEEIDLSHNDFQNGTFFLLQFLTFHSSVLIINSVDTISSTELQLGVTHVQSIGQFYR